MAQQGIIDELLPVINSILQLLKPNPEGNERRNLRLAKRMFKQLKREFKKDGFTQKELDQLEQLKDNIVQRTLELG